MNLLWTLLFTFPVLAGNKIVDDNSTEYSLPAEFRLNGKSTQAAFGTARERALLTTTRLIRNDKLIAMGAIVSPSVTYLPRPVRVWEQDWQPFQMVKLSN